MLIWNVLSNLNPTKNLLTYFYKQRTLFTLKNLGKKSHIYLYLLQQLTVHINTQGKDNFDNIFWSQLPTVKYLKKYIKVLILLNQST